MRSLSGGGNGMSVDTAAVLTFVISVLQTLKLAQDVKSLMSFQVFFATMY